jgi:tetratricopeptide (TPR) repeat protein
MVRSARFLSVAFVALLIACAAHEKAGDSAAAVGDWKRALSEYRTAVQRSPGDAKLRQKYDNAKSQATATSTRKAQACAAQGNWECALGEADFAISVDDSAAATLGALRADAARNLAHAKVSSARAAIARADLDGAHAALRTASSLSSAPDVSQAVRAASVEWAASAASAADQLRQSRRFPEALSLLSSAAEYDPSLRPRVVSLQSEYEQFKAAEHDRLVAEGDAALAAKRWSDAAASFQAAQQMKDDARTAAAVKYAGSMAAGDSAISKADWRAAQQSFRAALDSGQDKGGDAARLVEAVTVRTYAVRISSIFVQPTRPDGEPWVGRPDPLFGKLVTVAVGMYNPVAGRVAGKVVEELDKIPVENQPTLVMDITLPDGRRFVTPAHRGLYWNPPAQVTVATNAYDQRPLVFRVVHRAPNGSEQSVGVVQVPLSELAKSQQVVLRGASIAQLELTANPGTAAEGSVSQDLKPAQDATNVAPSFSTPSSGATGFRLTRVAAQLMPLDYQDEGTLDGPPEPFAEVIQGGRVVYKSSTEQNKFEAAWVPERTFLFVRPDEAVSVRVWDKDVSDDDLVFSYDFTVRELSKGTVEARTQRGSFVRLSFEPRRGEP